MGPGSAPPPPLSSHQHSQQLTSALGHGMGAVGSSSSGGAPGMTLSGMVAPAGPSSLGPASVSPPMLGMLDFTKVSQIKFVSGYLFHPFRWK